jgi:hypothetical protein
MHNQRQWRHGVWRLTHNLAQKLDVEDIMNACARWRLQSVCHRPNSLHHLIRPEEFGCQLGWSCLTDRDGGAMVQPEPRPVAHRQFQRSMPLVMLPLHQGLRLHQPATNFSEEDITISHLAIYRDHPRRAWLEGCHWWRSAAVDNLKWRRPQCRLVGSVVAIFGPR